jgi:hypothetical protein
MTKRELTGFRDLRFNGWIRNQLPDSSTGFCVSDLDFIIWNWKARKILLLEVKTRNRTLPKFQQIMFRNLAQWIRAGISNEWTFEGFHALRFSDTDFNDGVAYLNNKEVTEEQVIEYLSLEWTQAPIDFNES